MPKFSLDYLVKTTFAGAIEIEADSEEAAIAQFEAMDLGKLESGNGQIENYFSQLNNIAEVK